MCPWTNTRVGNQDSPYFLVSSISCPPKSPSNFPHVKFPFSTINWFRGFHMVDELTTRVQFNIFPLHLPHTLKLQIDCPCPFPWLADKPYNLHKPRYIGTIFIWKSLSLTLSMPCHDFLYDASSAIVAFSYPTLSWFCWLVFFHIWRFLLLSWNKFPPGLFPLNMQLITKWRFSIVSYVFVLSLFFTKIQFWHIFPLQCCMLFLYILIQAYSGFKL